MDSLASICTAVKEAQTRLALQNRHQKDEALRGVRAAIDDARREILRANEADLKQAQAQGIKPALIDRLLLNGRRIDAVLAGVDGVIRQDDPLGIVRRGWTLANGLLVEQITAPLGVAAIIYESRPQVAVDAAVLAYKAGCGILLRGSSTARESNRALAAAIRQGLEAGGGIPAAVAMLEGEEDHGDVDYILNARGYIDVVLPRGGRALIRRVVEKARIPVIETGEGNCHIYIEESADIPQALHIIENAKVQKPGACNAVETLLVHRKVLAALMPPLAARFAGAVELRCDDQAREAAGPPPPGLVMRAADDEDWETEFLDYILAVKTVSSLDEAVAHINHYGTRHSEAILTQDLRSAQEFCRRVDAACVYVNASTRFTDGGVFGFGGELGISTQKFHARGPLGMEALTTIQYRITGSGHIRPQE